MPLAELTRPDCQLPMTHGWLLDYRHNVVHPAEWIEAPPETSWTGRLKSGPRYEVVAYRCDKCGLLRMYADTQATASPSVYS